MSTQKQLNCKKNAALLTMDSEKSCEIKGGSQEMAVIVKIDGKKLNYDN